MNRFEKLTRQLAGAVVLAASIPVVAYAQAFPSKPIRVVVPFPPGGVDVTIRKVQARMSEDLGQPIVIENRAGANGFIGASFVARAAPDGYTLLATVSGTLIGGSILQKKTVPFDPIKDFTPITIINRPVELLVAVPSLPVESLKDLINYAKRNPGKLSFGHVGIGSNQHINGELINIATGMNIVAVPYKGFGPVIQGLLGNEIGVAPHVLSAIQSMLASGKVKALVTLDGKRFPGLANVPDMSETFPNFQKVPSWLGILGPADLPKPIAMRLYASVVKAVNSPDVRSKLEDTSVIVANTPEDFAVTFKKELEQTAQMMQNIPGLDLN